MTSSYLFTTMEAGGHASPALSVARELIARGHAVRMLGDPTLRTEVEASGVTFLPWERAPHRRLDDPPIDPAEVAGLSPFQAFAKARDELICGPAGLFAADVRAAVAAERPDCVVGDLMLPGAAIAAEAEGLPIATLAMTLVSAPDWGAPAPGPGLAPMSGPLGALRDRLGHGLATRLWTKGLPAINAARTGNGLAPLDSIWSQLTRPDRTLVLCSRALEFPGVTFPDHWELCGARVDDPAWAQPWTEPAGDGPLVLVSLSSDQMGQLPVLRRIAEGMGELRARVVITTGPCVDPADVPAPANVQVLRAAPHVEIMRRADAVVAHGGHGTVAKALALGVPLVCVPLGRDQFDIAARVRYAGAGVTVKAGAKPRAFARAVERVVAGAGYREAAGRIGLVMAEERATDRAADRLEALLTPAGRAAVRV